MRYRRRFKWRGKTQIVREVDLHNFPECEHRYGLLLRGEEALSVWMGQRDETRQTDENDGATSIVLDESQTAKHRRATIHLVVLL